MAWSDTKKAKKRRQKKMLKAIFGKSLPIVMAVVVIIGILFGYLYENVKPVRLFVDDIVVIFNPDAVRPFIDPEGDEMAVHFIDVGQGDSALLQTPKGSVLIDCGEKEYGDDVVNYLKSCGVTELEYFIVTHPDSDHMGSAEYVLKNVKVKNFVINAKEKSTTIFENMLDAAEDAGLETYIADAGDKFTVGALQLSILSPRVEDIPKLESNDSSLVILATYGERSFLFTGDAENEGEELLLKYSGNNLRCDVFSAGHHGSKTSNSLELLQAARPKFVVISCGKDNKYGHPDPEALESFAAVGATVYRTDELGTVIFVTDGVELTKK